MLRRCAFSLPGRCDSCSQGSFSPWRCWSVRAGLWDLGSPAVRRTLFGLSSLLAGALCWFLKLPGLAGLGCQEFLLAFWGKVVPLCSQVPWRPWFGCLTGNSENVKSVCMRVHVCTCAAPRQGPRANLRSASGTCLLPPFWAPLLWALAPSLASCPAPGCLSSATNQKHSSQLRLTRALLAVLPRQWACGRMLTLEKGNSSQTQGVTCPRCKGCSSTGEA